MKIIVRVISGAIVGVTIGFIIALVFSLLNQTTIFMPSTPAFVDRFSNNLMATLASAGLWALIGIVFDVASYLIFERSQWSITRQTVVHFVITYACFTPLAIIADWFPVQNYLISYTIEFVIIYVITWFISMQIAKAKVRRLNQLLSQKDS
ncbi:DUF3021 domain-containing protein [Lactobacillus sp. LC28-10]|uniref:DUF3021 domain-containing protein n=1 Tax=Secundilactobacillus angelensis TaxID=2722706 RepID=A0ABX1KXG9_9LACO|nr:DUF3021 domain-containing protein [Secundilactobacillus angelensis]MCH5461625.1 DUF3021 domain-containing protein [Secundilactobacillus angelensis]NLR17920.1 DUF3021 domain-containing protein [Secundilactobacillus angelensis]